MVQKLRKRNLAAAMAKVVSGDRVGALQAITKTETGHETTTFYGIVTIAASPEDAKTVSRGNSVLDPDVATDKPRRLAMQMNFAGDNGLFSAMQSDGHRDMRKPLSVLGAGGVAADLPDLNDEAILLAEKLSLEKATEVYPLVQEFAARVAMLTFFGLDPDRHQEEVGMIAEAFTAGEHNVFYRILKMEKIRGLEKSDTPLLSGKNQALRDFNDFLDREIERQAGKIGPVGENESVLSRLIGAQSATEETKAEIKEQLCQILMAAIQSTSSGISWILHDLARNPDAQQESRSRMGSMLEDGEVDIKESRLPEIGMIIDESLRLHSVVPLTLPRCPVGKTRGLEVVSLSAIHHDARNFPDPDRFDWRRMSPEAKKQRADGSFIPFFTGAHACPGQILYKTAAATAIAHLVHRLDISSPDAEYPDGKMGISNAPASKAKLNFTRLQSVPDMKLDVTDVAQPAIEKTPAAGPAALCPYTVVKAPV